MVGPLIFGNTLDTSLLNVELASQTLHLGIEAVSILEGLSMDGTSVAFVEKPARTGRLLHGLAAACVFDISHDDGEIQKNGKKVKTAHFTDSPVEIIKEQHPSVTWSS